MHNKAMRVANPSGIRLLPDKAKASEKRRSVVFEKRKSAAALTQKKSSVVAEADGTSTAEQCETAMKFQRDAALQSLRELRMKHFPPSEDMAKEEAENHKLEVVANLKADLAAHFMDAFKLKRQDSFAKRRDSKEVVLY
jgi:hypothetical protein